MRDAIYAVDKVSAVLSLQRFALSLVNFSEKVRSAYCQFYFKRSTRRVKRIPRVVPDAVFMSSRHSQLSQR